LPHFPHSSKTVLFLVCFGLPLFLAPSDSHPILAQINVRNADSTSKIFMTSFQTDTFCNILIIFQAILCILTYDRKTKNNVVTTWSGLADHRASTAHSLITTALNVRTIGDNMATSCASLIGCYNIRAYVFHTQIPRVARFNTFRSDHEGNHFFPKMPICPHPQHCATSHPKCSNPHVTCAENPICHRFGFSCVSLV
jgi:hypothetical protein